VTRTFILLLLIAIPIVSAGQAERRVLKPEIRTGDSWTYRSTNVITPGANDYEHRVSFTDGKVILLVTTRKSDGKEYDSSWTSDWNAVTSYSGRMFRPHTGFLRFPLRVGDTYQYSFDSMAPRSSTVLSVTKGSAKVAGWDVVDVPAGKFDAIKVEYESTTPLSDGSGTFWVRGTAWYAPDVRRWIKTRTENPKSVSTEELLAFKLNED
jgi:hypothetical protein